MKKQTITIENDVFAAIWSRYKDGDRDENDILRHILGCPVLKDTDHKIKTNGVSETENGIYDSRNNVFFREGFEIYRDYKGNRYNAVVDDGAWLLQQTGRKFPTINQMNRTIAAGLENVWIHWKYDDENGHLKFIDHLRISQ